MCSLYRLRVPYTEQMEAKQLGAFWSEKKKSYFVCTEHPSLDKFLQWGLPNLSDFSCCIKLKAECRVCRRGGVKLSLTSTCWMCGAELESRLECLCECGDVVCECGACSCGNPFT